jgi:hypothetical protein
MVSLGHPWSSVRAPSWDYNPWSSGRGVMVGNSVFLRGVSCSLGGSTPFARSCTVSSIEEATSPLRDHPHSNSCGCAKGLRVVSSMEGTGQDRAKGVEPPKLQDASPKKTDLPTIAPKPDDQGWQSHEGALPDDQWCPRDTI